MAQKAEIKYDPAYIMPSQIANRITALGYPATVLERETDGQNVVEIRASVVSKAFFSDLRDDLTQDSFAWPCG